jgi:diguanylate cyclase (GGDEF)-like protein
LLFISGIGVVASVFRQQDLAQLERQGRALAESAAQLRDLSVRDPLTGLFNRRYLEETLEREVSRASRAGTPLTVLMLDIDHFKSYNDSYGHSVGDELLRQVGAVLRNATRGSDLACRYGGEEFILLLPEAAPPAGLARAEQIREQVGALRMTAGGRGVAPVTFSIGLAAFPADGATGQALVQRADEALYAAKRAGRDRVMAASAANQDPELAHP